MQGLIDLVARVEARHKGKEVNLMPKYGIESRRTITVNGVPSVYLNVATEPKSGRYAMVPADADDLTRRIVALLNQAESRQ